MAQDVKFATYSFQSSGTASAIILTEDILYENIAEKNLNIKDDLIRDGFSYLDCRYSQRIIILKGWLISDTPTNLRTHIDTVKGYLRPNDQNLDIETYGGSTVYRRYKCSCRGLSVSEEHWMTTQKPYEAEFLCKPFSTATSATTVNLNSGGAITTTPYAEVVAITGTYNPKPTITITIGVETNMTAVRITNTTTLDWIEIARSFSAADVLIIDCDAETVKVGGVSVDFTGIFIGFIPGNNTISISTTDTGVFSITASITYYPTYL